MSEPESPPPDKTAASLTADLSLDEIAGAAEIEVATAQPDESLVAAERETLEAAKLKIENDRLKDELAEARDLHDLRKKYTGRLFWLIVCWLAAVVTFVTLTGAWKDKFSLADSVLIAFITSTTVSVLGLFVLVAKWLYPSAHKDETDNKKVRPR